MRRDWNGNFRALRAAIMVVGFLALGFSASSLKLPAALAAESAETVGQNNRIDSIRQELTKLKAELALKQGKYSSQHPDILRLKREIERLEHDLETANPPKPAVAIPRPAESIPKPAVPMPPQVQSHDSGLKPSGHSVEVKPGAHNLADTLANTASGTIVVLPGTHTLTTSRTLAPAVTLRVLKGAIIHVQDGVTLTCNGTLEAGSYQIFSWNRTGKVAFGAGAMTEVLTKWWGTIGDNSTDDAPALQNLITGLEATAMTVTFAPGTYKINADLTFPHNLRIRLPKGAILAPHEIACTGTISTQEPGDANPQARITVIHGTEKVAGSGTDFTRLNPGQWITTPGGQRRQIRWRLGEQELWVWKKFDHSEKNVAGYTYSENTLNGSKTLFGSQVKPYDFIYWDPNDASKHLVAVRSLSDVSLRLAEWPQERLIGKTFTRSVRVTIKGSLEAGLYQIFSGRGWIIFKSGTAVAVYPEWWGAWARHADFGPPEGSVTWDTAKANSDALEKAVYAQDGNMANGTHGPGGLVQLTTGVYWLSRHIPIPSGLHLQGTGRGDSNGAGTFIAPLCYAGTRFPDIAVLQLCVGNFTGSCSGFEINDLSVNGGAAIYGDATLKTQNNIMGILAPTSFPWGQIHHNRISGNWAVCMFGNSEVMVRDNFIEGIFAFYGGVDSFLDNNQIYGSVATCVNNGHFTSADGWTYDGWTIAGGKATHTPGNTKILWSNLLELNKGTSGYQFPRPGKIAVRYNISGNTNRGRIRVRICNQDGHIRISDGDYCELIECHDPDPANIKIEFVPLDGGKFNGSISMIDARFGTLVMAVTNNNIRGNIIFSDGGAAVDLFLQSSGSIVTDNQIGPGAMIGCFMTVGCPKVFSHNAINSFRCYGIVLDNNCRWGQITENHIRGGGAGDPAQPYPPISAVAIGNGSEDYEYGSGSGYVIKNNHFQIKPGNGAVWQGMQFSRGCIWPLANTAYKTEADWPLIEDNYGYDLAPVDGNDIRLTSSFPTLPPGCTTYPQVPSASTPSVLTGRKFKVVQTGPTDLTDLTQGCIGKEVLLFFKDNYSTIKFSTSSTLKGNGGMDWNPKTGDAMRAIKGDDGKWLCTIISSTNNAMVSQRSH